MVAVRLDDTAIAYAAATLQTAGGGMATAIRTDALWEPVVFLPDFVDPLTLPELEYGGVGDSDGANAELASYLLFLKKRNGRLHSLICCDPWSVPGDLDYRGTPPDELLMLHGEIHYLHDIAEASPETVWGYRARAVSFFGIVCVSEATPAEIRTLAEEGPNDLFAALARTVRHVAITAYDGESWLILRHERRAAGGGCDCEGDFGDPDCRHHE